MSLCISPARTAVTAAGLLASAALALAPSPAQAGVGFSAGGFAYTDGTSFAPSIDYRAKGLLVQVHLLDLLSGPAVGGGFALNTGADVTYVVIKKKCAPEVEGVFMPGIGFRVADLGDIGFNAMAKARFGAEMKKGIGFGMYVVPALGVSNFYGKITPNYGGGVEVSAWFVEGKQ